MTEQPILFTGEMVRAIFNGRKTQTRRIAKLTDAGHVKEPRGHRRWHPGDPEARLACPYGQPGGLLWVKETHAYVHPRIAAGRQSLPHPTGGGEVNQTPPVPYRVIYRADGEMPEDDDPRGWEWRPSIFMAKKAARLWLRVTDVRVERLWEITEEDARAEGVAPAECTDGSLSHVQGFLDLWEEINAKRAPAASNPWVWVVGFEREVSE